jgi:hypothetical protein
LLPSSNGGRYEIGRHNGAVCDIVADKRINLSLPDLQKKRNNLNALSDTQKPLTDRHK